MRRIAHLTTVVLTTVVLTPALAAVSAAQTAQTAPAANNASGEDTPVIVDGITPRAAEEDSTIRVTGEIANTTEEVLDDVTVRLRYSSDPVGDRSELDAHAEGDRAQPPEIGASTGLDSPLQPGENTEFELEADTEDLDLGVFGVYPMAVDAVDGSEKGLGIQYTFLPYQGGGEGSDPVDIAWVWPLMDRPQRADENTYLGEGLTSELQPEGRLNRLLAVGAQDGEVALEPLDPSSPSPDDTETEDAPQDDGEQDADDRVPITWAVDPGLLSDIERLTTDSYHVLEDPLAVPAESQPTAKTHDPSPEATAWLEQARTIIGDDPLVSTPYASPDIAALLRNDLESDADASMSLAKEVLRRVLERPADPGVALPADGVMDEATRDFFTEHGAERFLLRDAAMPAHDWAGHTPTAQAELPVEDGDATALVADSRLTDVLDSSSHDPGEAALVQQRFAAETALVSSENADHDRTIVASPPPGWDPSPELAQDVLRSSQELPWLEPTALDDVEGDSDAEPKRHGLTYAGDAAGAELSGTYLDQVKGVRREVRLFNSILTEDSDPFRPAVLRLESAAWREDEALGNQTRSLLGRAVTDARGKVRVIESEPVTLASKTGTIGVLVANDLEDETVSVHLSMFSSNSERLDIGDYQESMEIGPGGKTTVYVPLTARVNGRTVLHMSLHNADGEPVSTEETSIPVHATGMGTQALIISAGGALVLVIALAPRALRRWRRANTPAGAETQAGGESETGAEERDHAPESAQDNGGDRTGGPPEESDGTVSGDSAAGTGESEDRDH